MWIPTPIYERIPQFWFLLGLLFFATGLYLGFEFALSFWYMGVGFACCTYGVGIFLVRISHRRSPEPAAHGTVSAAIDEHAPAEAVQVESAAAD